MTSQVGLSANSTFVNNDNIEAMAADLTRAYKVLREGGVILVKGDIGYGLLAHSDDSLRKMFDLKGRPTSNSAIVIGNLAILQEIVTPLPSSVLKWLFMIAERTTLAVAYWLNPKSRFWLGLSPWVRSHSSEGDTVAVFLNTGPFAECLITMAAKDNFLIVGSSANLSSRGNTYRFEDIPKSILEGVDLALDHGPAKYENDEKLATTIVDLRSRTIRRRGVNAGLIESSLRSLSL